MLIRYGAAVQARLDAGLWTDVYGVARTALALSTLVTLLGNGPGVLFGNLPAGDGPPVGLARYSLFVLLAQHPGAARWLAVGVLVLVVSGWRPRWTALPHAWVALSFALSVQVIDGGDQINGIFTLLLLPIALTDRRGWHWASDTAQATGTLPEVTAALAAVAIRVQVAGIYLHACFAKFGVREWADGTAMYYWLGSAEFGAPRWLAGPLSPVLTSAAGVTSLTWGALAVEFLLTCALLLGPPARRWLLVVGVAFHGMIAVTMGLVSFALTMTACLILYLRPLGQPFRATPIASGREPLGGLLIYDGDCGFCQASLHWLHARLPRWPQCQPNREVAVDALGLQPEGVRQEIHYVRGGQPVAIGAAAFAAILADQPGAGWRMLGAMLGHRPGSALAGGMYRVVAAHRHRLGSGACAVDSAYKPSGGRPSC